MSVEGPFSINNFTATTADNLAVQDSAGFVDSILTDAPSVSGGFLGEAFTNIWQNKITTGKQLLELENESNKVKFEHAQDLVALRQNELAGAAQIDAYIKQEDINGRLQERYALSEIRNAEAQVAANIRSQDRYSLGGYEAGLAKNHVIYQSSGLLQPAIDFQQTAIQQAKAGLIPLEDAGEIIHNSVQSNVLNFAASSLGLASTTAHSSGHVQGNISGSSQYAYSRGLSSNFTPENISSHNFGLFGGGGFGGGFGGAGLIGLSALGGGFGFGSGTALAGSGLLY